MAVRSLLANRRYASYLVSRVSLIMAMQMLSVAVGWQVYVITNGPLALGLSGLAIFLPNFLMALPGGHVADRRDRRSILLVCHLVVTVAAALLAYLAWSANRTLWPIYTVLVVLGANRSFSGPAGQAFMPSLVPREQLERAVALGSSAWQVAMIAGPTVAGLLYSATGKAHVVFAASTGLALVAVVAVILIGDGPVHEVKKREPASFGTVVAGLRYVWSNKEILGAISLDLFAVLLGGAVALLPIYAKDILVVGPWGFGILRAAPAFGASLMAALLAVRPLRGRAGAIMFACVFLFGLATIVFGVSKTFALSVAALVVLGGADMISVVVRSTLIQIRTPDEMRGRVSAVNLVFIGASNELGEFESGVTAAWLGPELAVVAGGIGTCLVVVAWALMFPALRKVDRLDA
ncbi:MAG: MFS transporter [Deltaproteobacteria bacterium]|nr:MFS transporter [Deltaproteobacteria bacterium]